MIGALNNLNLIHRGPCTHCSTDLQYVPFEKIKVFKRKKYCSQQCLNDHYKTLGYPGAVHHVHQMFGPEHPVTKQIQKMHAELKQKNRALDLYGKSKQGIKHFVNNFFGKRN